MQTITIKVNNNIALKLLEDLEALSLIQVIKTNNTKEEGVKLSERLAGSISHEDAQVMRKELTEVRNGWERTI